MPESPTPASPSDPQKPEGATQPLVPADPGLEKTRAGGPSAKPVRRRRRRPWVIGAMFLGLLLLVLLLPMLLSMGWCGIVVAEVDKKLNGQIEIADYSITWTGGIKASGIKLKDQDGREVAEIGLLSTQLSLINAIRGRYDLGQTIIRGVGFTVGALCGWNHQSPEADSQNAKLLRKTTG